MKTRFLFLFFVPLFVSAQVTNTNQVASVRLNYSRLSLRDKNTWATAVQSQRTNNATAWQQLWNKMWGWRFNAATSPTNAVQQGNNQQLPAPTNAPPVVTPPVQAPQPAPQIGAPNSNLQSAINIDNLNNTIWRNSGWQIVNPYESVLRDYRAAARAQRDFAMNPMSQMGGMGQMGGMIDGYGSQMGMSGMGQMGNYSSQFGGSTSNQQGGMYGSPNNGMGGYANMFGAGSMGGYASQGMNFNQNDFNSSSMMGLGMARGRMNGYNAGYGGMSTQTVPYF